MEGFLALLSLSLSLFLFLDPFFAGVVTSTQLLLPVRCEQLWAPTQRGDETCRNHRALPSSTGNPQIS